MQRMLHIERQGREANDEKQLPRQLFITASKKLTTKTQRNFTGINTVETGRGVEMTPLPHCLSDLRQEHFPLFLTLDQFMKVSRLQV
jgi:hypothetical protein